MGDRGISRCLSPSNHCEKSPSYPSNPSWWQQDPSSSPCSTSLEAGAPHSPAGPWGTVRSRGSLLAHEDGAGKPGTARPSAETPAHGARPHRRLCPGWDMGAASGLLRRCCALCALREEIRGVTSVLVQTNLLRDLVHTVLVCRCRVPVYVSPELFPAVFLLYFLSPLYSKMCYKGTWKGCGASQARALGQNDPISRD